MLKLFLVAYLNGGLVSVVPIPDNNLEACEAAALLLRLDLLDSPDLPRVRFECEYHLPWTIPPDLLDRP